jgi:hypothetical protein
MTSSGSDHNGLECKVKWRRITFGRNISENEAEEVLAALQVTLPTVAKKLSSFKSTLLRLELIEFLRSPAMSALPRRSVTLDWRQEAANI